MEDCGAAMIADKIKLLDSRAKIAKPCSAEIAVSYEPTNGLYHVTIRTDGATTEDCRILASRIIRFMAGGRTAFVRRQPEASEYVSFETQKTSHRGFARFSFRDESGNWHLIAQEDLVLGTIGATVKT